FLPPNPDMEEGEGAPDADVGPPKLPEIPGVEEEGEAPSPDVAAPSKPQPAPKAPRVPDVEAEPPSRGVEAESDPDVAAQLFPPPGPDAECPRRPGIPDVGWEPLNPDVGGTPGPTSQEAEVPPTPQVRRSQRLAARQGGGASAGPTPSQKERDQAPKSCPSAKPHPQRRWSQAGAAPGKTTPIAPINGSGRGSVSALPLQEEEEPAGGAKRRLRPRAAPGPAHIRVLFTGLVASPALLVALGTLGGTEATSVHDCSHLVTDGIRRTLKFLCALARGVPIVTPQWLLQSSQGGRPLSPGPFLPRDPPWERRFGFSLSPALARARARPLLQVTVSPSVPKCPQ
ncbi:MDC1 protein, partial [Chaetops frenatus]|nr:MDC1 protein [Chaetops frenatus]